jgi:hypothetical protein
MPNFANSSAMSGRIVLAAAKPKADDLIASDFGYDG